MAKKSKLAEAQKQQAAVDRFIDYRNELKANGEHEQLNRLPKDSSPVRLRNRCAVTGRPRGYMRKFGMSRIAFRELAHKGQIPGVRKASW